MQLFVLLPLVRCRHHLQLELFKLLSILTCLSSPVVRMHICILMKNTGKITSVKHVYFPVVSYFCVPETKGMDTKQLESIYSRYQLTSHWHCLSSFTFTHQQVYLLLLLLSHLNKLFLCYFTFTLNQVYQIDFIRRQSFYREEEEASVSSLLAEDSSKASPRGQVIKQFQSIMTVLKRTGD